MIRPIGHGAYGVVISALDKDASRKVAIKKISKAFADPVDAKRILREIKLMKALDHENVRVLITYTACVSLFHIDIACIHYQ
jgi:mitogen-activated protein kinase 1/3